MGWWPFSRKRKRKPKSTANQGGHSERAQERRRQMRENRGKRTQTGAASKPRKQYVPPPVPDDPSVLPRSMRAPEGPAVWGWVKRAPIDYWVEAWYEYDPEGFEDFRKWPQAPTPKVAHKIRRHVLDMIMEAGKSQMPNEFGAMMRAEKGIIEELVLLPGTLGGETSAIFQMHMMPVDMSIIGTIHTHPSPIPYPSAADTALFERYGRVHIIAAVPFGPDDWRAFDHRSRLVKLEVVD